MAEAILTRRMEAPIGMTEHVRLVPGMRLLAVNGGWTLRPAVALGWTF